MQMLVIELLRYGVQELQTSGVENAEVDVQLLLGYCLGKSRTQLYLAAEENVPERIRNEYFALLKRRKNREPVAYLLGEREFWSLPFLIDTNVLIPRPETEYLLESVLSRVGKLTLNHGRVLDVCCGSGVIAIILALELQKKIVAIDISINALCIAQKNAQRHGVEKAVNFINGDLFSSISKKNQFSLIVTNPPYIERDSIATLDPEVQRYEPLIALDGGEDGLDSIRRIITSLPELLMPGGMLFMEIGAEQKEGIQALLEQAKMLQKSMDEYAFIKDYSDRYRILYIKLNE